MATDTPHAMLSPSKISRIAICPGSVALSHGAPDSSSVYADEGTAAHELAASALLSKDQVDCDAYIGQVIKVRNEDGTVRREFTVDDDMASYVQQYVDEVRRQADGAELLVEQRVDYSDAIGIEDQSGTADAVILDFMADTLGVHDLKYGKGVQVYAAIEVDDMDAAPFVVERDYGFFAPNLQLLCYALGAYLDHEILADWETIKLGIHMPRKDFIDEFEITPAELKEFANILRAICNDAMAGFVDVDTGKYDVALLQENGLLTANEDACRWCPARDFCPELRDTVQSEVFDDFEDLTVKDLEHVEAHFLPSFTVLELCEIWVKAARSRIETELLAGNEVPTWKLVQGRKGPKKWINDTIEDLKKKLRGMRLKKTDIYEEKLKSPTQLLKVDGVKGNKRREKVLEEFFTQSEGGYSIASESDKREAVVISPVADDFEDLDKE